MSGIYIHIPFCKKACNYCNFHFSTNRKDMELMAYAIGAEADLQKNYLSNTVATIYFGGGTPSLLSPTQLGGIMQKLYAIFTIDELPEITLEANPDDITAEALANWKNNGINRLSIGVQSFQEEDLQWMNRAHTAQQALTAIQMAQDAGFENISIDLIYGTPTLSNDAWEKNMQIAFKTNVPHLSCYALTVEPKTALAYKINEHQLPDVDTHMQATHFNMLVLQSEAAGYEQYEISNFSQPGKRSKHNTNYWLGVPYLGLGPAAHSYNGNSRQWNVANNKLYIDAITEEKVPFEIELLTPQQKLNEYLMTALRTIEGVELKQLNIIANEPVAESIIKDAEKYITTGKMQKTVDHLRLTAQGKFYADGIAADLFRL